MPYTIPIYTCEILHKYYNSEQIISPFMGSIGFLLCLLDLKTKKSPPTTYPLPFQSIFGMLVSSPSIQPDDKK